MNPTPSPITPDTPEGITAAQAREALAAAESVNPTTGSHVRRLQFFCIAVGAAMAAVLVLVRATIASDVARFPVFIAGMAVYGALIVALVMFQRRVGSLPKGWARYWIGGFAVTTALYAVWISVVSSGGAADPASWWLVAVAAITVVLPGAVAAVLIGRSAAKAGVA
ncbi:hypothetical protein ACSDQ9_08685 [Aestuariimicrobium soli]|uniref:hypothetical protein n=1 Tax=Aestuariimicrobium soli TaxID=2035834 RepID=UPI003EBBCAC5